VFLKVFVSVWPHCGTPHPQAIPNKGRLRQLRALIRLCGCEYFVKRVAEHHRQQIHSGVPSGRNRSGLQCHAVSTGTVDMAIALYYYWQESSLHLRHLACRSAQHAHTIACCGSGGTEMLNDLLKEYSASVSDGSTVPDGAARSGKKIKSGDLKGLKFRIRGFAAPSLPGRRPCRSRSRRATSIRRGKGTIDPANGRPLPTTEKLGFVKVAEDILLSGWEAPARATTS